MALGVDSASNRNEYQVYFLGDKDGRCVRLTTLPPSCAVVMKSGNLNFLEPSGPLQACNGTALPFNIYVVKLFVPFPVQCCRHCAAITKLYMEINLTFFKGSREMINNSIGIVFCGDSIRICLLLQQKQIKQQLKVQGGARKTVS